ncbi:hypothetical protein ACFL4M_01200 [Pseudomonadota bacterium]
MKKAPIKEILIDKDDQFCVVPDVAVCGDFEFIWRDASGIRWEPMINALIAYEPKKWEPLKLFEQMMAAVAGEYGWQLYLNDHTEWKNVPGKLRKQIETWSQIAENE